MNVDAILTKIKRYPVAVTCIVLAVVLIGVLYMRRSHIPALEEEMNQMEGKWKAIGENKLHAVDLSTHLEKLNVISDNIEGRLMSADSKAINYQYFFKLEKSSGVRIEDLNQRNIDNQSARSGAPKFELFQPIVFTVTAEGTFKQILTFLYEMQHGIYFTIIKDFSCSSIEAEEGKAVQDLLSLSVTLQVLGVK